MIHHIGFKRFVCNFCGKDFAQNQYLKEHINIHTNKFPYPCEFPGCSAKFKQRSRLCLHNKKMHQASERPIDIDDGPGHQGHSGHPGHLNSDDQNESCQNSNHDQDSHAKFIPS